MRSASHRKPLIRNVCVEILRVLFRCEARGSPHGESRNPAGLASMNFRGKFRPGRARRRKERRLGGETDRGFFGQPSDLPIGEYPEARSERTPKRSGI